MHRPPSSTAATTSESPASSGPGAGDECTPPPGLPVILDLYRAHCLVVGGGPVATRKVVSLLAAAARVTVVATKASPELQALAQNHAARGSHDHSGPCEAEGELEIFVRRAEPVDVDGCLLVVCATGDPSVDDAMARAAREAGALVNRADHGERMPGSIDLAAVHRSDSVTVAVSTGGGSPALARWLRDRVAAALGPDIATLAEIVEEARVGLAATGRPTASIDWASALDQIAPLVAEGRIDDARALLADVTAAE